MSTEQKPLTAEEILYINISDDSGHPEWNEEEIVNAMEEYAAQQTAALREELEAAKQTLLQEREIYDDVKSNMAFSHHELNKELEAAKKEGDDYNEKYQHAHNAYIKTEMERDQWVKNWKHLDKLYQGQKTGRDEAVRLLQEVYQKIMAKRGENRVPTYNKVRDFLLSSGETKPVSQWISVEERLPEEFKDDLSDQFITMKKSGYIEVDHYHKGGYWMMDMEDDPTTFYMPLPAPPESLTDKK